MFYIMQGKIYGADRRNTNNRLNEGKDLTIAVLNFGKDFLSSNGY